MAGLPASFFGKVFFILQNYWGSLLAGAGRTIAIAIVGTFFGVVIGLLVGTVMTVPKQMNENPVKTGFMWAVKKLLFCYIEFFRGTPMMVQAMFIYYGMIQYANYDMGMWKAAFFIVSINTGAYMAETVRGGILSIDKGQTEGAKAIGMTHIQTMRYVIMPQAIRNIMPQIGNNLIINIKDSSVLSVIGVIELYYAAKQTAGAYYWWFEAMTVAMVLYLIMTFVFSRLLRFWESKLDGPASFDLATTDQLAHTSGNYSYPGEGSFDKERNIETDVNGGRDK